MSISTGSNASVTSSLYEFVEENGRTFHRYKEGSEFALVSHPSGGKSGPMELTLMTEYFLPNDEVG